MGAKSLSPNKNNQQGGDVPAFDLPPSTQVMGADPRTWSPYPIQGGAVPQVAQIPQFQQVSQGPQAQQPPYLPQLPPAPQPAQNQLSMPQNMDPGFLEFLRQKYGNMAQSPLGQMQGGMTPFAGVQNIPPGMAPQGYPQPPMMGGGMGAPPQRSPEEELRMLYQTQLGREGDQGGMDYWRQRMAEGMTPDQMQDIFRGSQEGQDYQRRMAPMIDDFGYGHRRMHPDVEDALRLALERNRPERTYTPEEWSATFGTNVEPDPRMIRQDSQPQGNNMPAVMSILRGLGVA